jgi:threonine/homoserine/homoserine lactone efflux protein
LTSLTLPFSLEALVITGFLVSFATVVIPGPITLVATRLGLAHRLGAAFWFLFGATVLDALLFAALAAGAGPSLARLGALPAVEIAGGLVLLYGALTSAKQLAHPAGPTRAGEVSNERPWLSYFFLGMGVSLANPHYWLWWVTAGLAFVEAARAYGEPGLLWMLGALIGGVVAWYAPLLLALHHGRSLLSPKAERLVIRALSLVLLILGLGLLALGSYRLGLAWFS